MKNENVLITGGAGYIGSWLASNLVKLGYNVTVIDNLEFGVGSIAHLFGDHNFSFVRGDVRDISLMKKLLINCDIVIPLAALVGAPLCSRREKDAKEINELSIVDLKEELSPSQKVIYCNTNSGYGVGYSAPFYDENSPLNPSSLYGRTKKAAEDILMQRENTISFRLASVFGCSYRERNDLLLHFLVKEAVQKRKIEVYEPNYKRNFIHIRDVVDAIKYVLINFEIAKTNAYNLVNGNENISKLDLAFKIANHNPQVVIQEITGPIDPDKRDYIVSGKKIERLGFNNKYSINDGISEMSSYYKFLL